MCASPDDDYSGGYLKFVFTEAVNLTGMDVFDIDHGEAGSKVYFFNEGEGWGDSGVETIDLPTSIGDGNVGFVGFGDKGQNITMMKIKFTGSGAIDNIRGQSDDPQGGEVPEPGALAIILTGLLGYGLTRRKRTSVITTA